MVEFPDKNIYLYSEGIDFRKGIKSLSNLISVSYPNSNLTDSLFIFFSKDKKQVKILEIEEEQYAKQLLVAMYLVLDQHLLVLLSWVTIQWVCN